MAKKLISLLTVLSIVFSSFTALTVTAEESSVKSATQITSAEQLVSGQYVIVTETNFAMTVLDGTWVLSKAVTVLDGKLSDVTSDMIWNVTTDGASASLTDSNGTVIAPKGGNNNGIAAGDYSWSVVFNDGMFQFAGVDTDTVRLASNVASDSKFRAYKNTTIDKSPNGYIANFYVFAIDAEDGSETPDEPDAPTAPETNEYGTAVSTGSCGAEAVWTLYDSGTLVISGKGEMDDFQYGSAPWYSSYDSIQNVIVQEGVTTVGAYSFYDCQTLQSVTLAEGVTTIGDSAFGNSGLYSINIPASLTTIESSAFALCTGVNVYITDVEQWCNVSSQSALMYSDGRLYLNGEELVDLVIPEGVTDINGSAFCGCSSIVTVTIPKSVVNISASAFSRCTALESVTVDENNEYYSSDDSGVLFNKDKTELIQYPAGSWEYSYIIPDSVTMVKEDAFKYSTHLTDITIGKGMSRIGEYAFDGCTRLTSVNIPKSVTEIGEGAFQACTSLDKAVYAGSKSTWKNIAIGDNNAPLLNAEIVYLTVEAEGVEISSLPSKLEYAYGESLSLDGIVVKVYFSDGSVEETTEYTVSEFNKYSYGKQTLTVFYGELFAEFSVTVKGKPATRPSPAVTLGMTVGELKASYGEQTVYVMSSDGKTVLSDSDVVKTGSVIQIVQDGAVVDSAALVVESDVNGDGRLTAKDFIRLKKQIAQGSWVEYPEYADINRDGVVDTLDLEALAEVIA